MASLNADTQVGTDSSAEPGKLEQIKTVDPETGGENVLEGDPFQYRRSTNIPDHLTVPLKKGWRQRIKNHRARKALKKEVEAILKKAISIRGTSLLQFGCLPYI
jgi:hypothetical protein